MKGKDRATDISSPPRTGLELPGKQRKEFVPRSRNEGRKAERAGASESTGIKGEVSNKDRLSRARRSWNMSRIRGKNTTPEMLVRSMLHKMGYRFRLHVKIPVPDSLPFASRRRFIIPDIVLPKYKTAIFVHGCFWHRHKGCKYASIPTHRREWWLTKLNGNAQRDKLHQRTLNKLGWKTIVIWECRIEKAVSIKSLGESVKVKPPHSII